MTLKQLRGHMGLTQKEMGDRLGVTPQMIGQWERGERIMSGSSLIHLTQEFQEIRVTIGPEGMRFFLPEKPN